MQSLIFWFFAILVFLWTIPGAGKTVLAWRTSKTVGHYLFFLLPCGLLFEHYWRIGGTDIAALWPLAIGILFVVGAFIQANSGYQGRDSFFGIFFALSCFLFFAAFNFFANVQAQEWRITFGILFSLFGFYLYAENLELGVRKEDKSLPSYKNLAALLLYGISFLFLSQEFIYPRLKVNIGFPDLQLFPLFFMAEVCTRLLLQKKTIADTFAVPSFLEVGLTGVAHFLLLISFFGMDYGVQFAWIAFLGALLYRCTKSFAMAFYIDLFLFFILIYFFPFPRLHL